MLFFNQKIFDPKFVKVGLTYDDVLILPEYTDIQPDQIDLSVHLSKRIKLNIPLLSSAMDTVTESVMAIAMAKEGGMGVIHRNLSIEDQAENVYRVKRYNSEIISDPIFIQSGSTINDLYNMRKRFHISGLPVVNKDGILLGIITNRDTKFIEETSSQFLSCRVDQFMTKLPLITGHIGISRKDAFLLLQKYKIEKLPLINHNGKLKGLITVKDFNKEKLYPYAAKDNKGRFLVGAAIGFLGDSWKRVMTLIEAGVDVLFLDTANGYNAGAYKIIKRLKNDLYAKNVDIIGGQAATYESAKFLINAGVDGIRVGVGPGSICTTRIVSGIGVPQITAIYESSKAVNDSLNNKKNSKIIPLIGDGGIQYAGDIGKAFVAGANTVMIGSLFAGCEESPGNLIFFNGKQYKSYRGMGSLGAIQDRGKNSSYSGDKYYQNEANNDRKMIPEGIEGQVPYKGPLSGVINQLIGGLRKTMFYVGSKNIYDLQKKGRFMQITAAGLKESHPHNICIPIEQRN